MINKTLSPLFLALLFVVLTACSPDATAFGKVSAEQAVEMLANEQAIIIDVREQSEWDTGHIPDALFIPLGQLKSRIAELDVYKGKPIIMQCRSGVRSARASSIMVDAGFEQVYNLTGGIIAWSNAGLIIE